MHVLRKSIALWMGVFVCLLLFQSIQIQSATGTEADDASPAPKMKIRVFNQSDYDPSSVTKKTYSHGEVQITLIQVKDIKDSPVEGLGGFCRAWLMVQKGNNLIEEKYYDDIYPLGSSYGLFVPRKQPSPNYFIVIVLGGYDGRLLLIDKKGTIVDLMGGPFFTSSDGRFLFSDYHSDQSGLTVFDLIHGEVIYSSTMTPYIQYWYKSKQEYFFTESDWDRSKSGLPDEKQGLIHAFDFATRTVIKKGVDLNKVKNARRIKYDFYPDQHFLDCTCNK